MAYNTNTNQNPRLIFEFGIIQAVEAKFELQILFPNLNQIIKLFNIFFVSSRHLFFHLTVNDLI